MPDQPQADQRLLLATTAVALSGLLLWDASSLDLALARVMGGDESFPLRESFLLSRVLHDGARRLAWVAATLLSLAVWWPVGPLRRLDVQSRAQIAVTALLAPLAVSSLKWFSVTSCPWDLDMFGGVARYFSHWSSIADGGSGHCFPAGHASAGFGLLGGYFAFRNAAPRISRAWLQGSLAAGMVLGVAQQIRGAHFMSHTLWTAFICWCVAYALDSARKSWRPAALSA
jgi:membrane-associated PAP2 superfamily phosphatase